jgi:hypothetical protein
VNFISSDLRDAASAGGDEIAGAIVFPATDRDTVRPVVWRWRLLDNAVVDPHGENE